MSSPISPTVVVLIVCNAVWGQEQSLRPGINDSFAEPVVGEWVERFEREGREVYDQRDAIIAASGISPGMVVADVGAGTGLFTRLIAATVGPEGLVYAVDISDEFIANIQQRARESGTENIQGVVCSADDVRLAPASVDLVYVCDTYHHFEYPYKTMASIHKALRPHGRLVVVDFERIEGVSTEWVLGHVRAGKRDVRQEIEAAGFRWVADKTDLMKENYLMIFEKV